MIEISVYSSSFRPADTYLELLVRLEAALKHCSDKYDIPLSVGVSVKGYETFNRDDYKSPSPTDYEKTLQRYLQAL